MANDLTKQQREDREKAIQKVRDYYPHLKGSGDDFIMNMTPGMVEFAECAIRADRKRDEMHNRLMTLAAVMYQIAGANLMPMRIMDTLSVIQRGGWADPSKMLPYIPEENDKEWKNVDSPSPTPSEPELSLTAMIDMIESRGHDEVPVRTRAAGGDLAGAVDGSVE